MNLLDIIGAIATGQGMPDLSRPVPPMSPQPDQVPLPRPRPTEAPQDLPADAITSFVPTEVQRAERGMEPIPQGGGGLLSAIAPNLDDKTRIRMTSALGGGLSGMNPAFKLGAFGAGMGGALKAGNKSEFDLFDSEINLIDRMQKARAAGDVRAYNAARTDYYRAMADKARRPPSDPSSRPPRSSPTSAVWNDARFRFDKARRAVENAHRTIDGDFRLKPEEREARKQEEAATIYERYGLNPDGSAPAASAAPATKRAGKPDEISFDGDGTQAAPYKPMSKDDYDQIAPGTYYIHPSTGQLKLKK